MLQKGCASVLVPVALGLAANTVYFTKYAVHCRQEDGLSHAFVNRECFCLNALCQLRVHLRGSLVGGGIKSRSAADFQLVILMRSNKRSLLTGFFMLSHTAVNTYIKHNYFLYTLTHSCK